MDSEDCEQTTASTFEIINSKDRRRFSQEDAVKKLKYILLLACLLLVIAGVTTIVIVLVTKKVNHDSQTIPKVDESSSNKTKDRGAHEALERFLTKVHDKYFEVYFDEIFTKINVTKDEIREKIRPFDYSPAALKRAADTAALLRSELESLFTPKSEATLTQRELRALYEVRTFLKYFRGPYDTMYYSGDWMLGPNTMGWQPIGTLLWMLQNILYYKYPRSVDEAEGVIENLRLHRKSIEQYQENMKMGVKAGMVRNIEACKGGLLAFKSTFHLYVADNGTGILSFFDVSSKGWFLKYFTEEMKRDWNKKHGKNIKSSLTEALVLNIGRPYKELIRYIEDEHLQHCVPSNVSSGLASLPLTHVFVNGVPDLSRPTHPYLPTGERLNGSKSFVQILPYFTTNDITPRAIKELGQVKLKEFYGKAVALAKQVTNETETNIAVTKFRTLLSKRSQFFNVNPFPVNESAEVAFLKCYDQKSAQKHCPERWKAFTKWKESTQSIHKILHNKIKPLFYTNGKKKTTLSGSCTGRVEPNFTPSSSFHSYQARSCGTHYLPFFVDNFGPKFAEWTTTAHETEPGHNLEVNGYKENFRDKTKDVISWLGSCTYFSGFSEGWAAYSENPLVGQDIDAYRDDLMNKYGMIQQEILTALRLIIETGLHYYGMSRSEALTLFDDYAWDTSDIASKEITRYQSLHGHSVSYLVGQTALIKARTFAEKELGINFSLPEFHYQVLHQGELTLDYLDKYIRYYVACAKGNSDPESNVCEDVLA